MKKVQTKSVFARTLLAVAAFMLAFSFNTVKSKAYDATPGFSQYLSSGSEWTSKGSLDIASLFDIEKGDKISFNVADKSICSAKLIKTKNKGKIYYSCYITPKKAGTTDITCTVTRGAQVYTTKYTFTGVKYDKPISSIKIGKKDYAKALKKSPYLYGTKLKGTQKIDVQTTDRYTVESISVSDGKKNSKLAMYENGDTVNLKKCAHLIVLLKDKQSGDYRSVSIIKNKKK
ncbi:hypothetical protein [Butyrivibrio sp. AE3004]|uniref:hypothetical protein n=1 Tax=Butyrivibrio sp. AE3004 TaxID=1506994 RepID=UPI0004941E3E|nr:hypothetical protein [Butyrivibrio sp. AE3004]